MDLSNAEQREYGGNAYQENGIFSFSEGQQGDPCTYTGCTLNINTQDIPAGADLLGTYHTHPDIGQGASLFSSVDIEGDMTNNPPLYDFIGTGSIDAGYTQVIMFDPTRYTTFMSTAGAPPPVCVLVGIVFSGTQPCH